MHQVEHIPHLWPGKDQGLQFSRFYGDFFRDGFPDLGDEAALVVGDLALVRFVGPVVLHGTKPGNICFEYGNISYFSWLEQSC
ncbi:MAG TPA: hypothetical protein DDY86_02300 [Syntrophaceae bacterium]|nr:hypothetical protein [Syntrophaceae bacterium]